MFNWTKTFARRNWENKPSQKTSLGAANLNAGDYALNEIDNRVIALDTAKFDKTDAQGLFKDVSLDKKTGVITFTLVNGSTKTLDTLLEKIAVNFDFDEETQKLVITLDDGTTKEIDMSALITQYEFLDSDTIAFVLEGGKVKAIVKEGSISEKHLRTDYLADIKVQAASAESSASSAASSANDADYDASLAQSYSVGGSGIRDNEDEDNAKYYKEQSALNATEAAQSAVSAAEAQEKSALNADSAESSAADALTSKNGASQSALSAAEAAQSAESAAGGAKSEAEAAAVSAKVAAEAKAGAAESAAKAEESKGSSNSAALLSQSYAVGGTGSREGEDTDNARYYYEQTKEISGADNYLLRSQVGAPSGVAGLDENGFVPASQLPSFVDDVIEGQYINSTEFVGTDGVVIVPESGKVYVDVSTGNVTSGKTYRWSGTRYVVIGSDLALGETSSTAFRGDLGKAAYDHSQQTGNPHGTTATDVGLGNVPNVSTNNQTVTYTEAASLSKLASGEKMTVAFGKLAKAVSSLISMASEMTTLKKSVSDGKTAVAGAITDNGVTTAADAEFATMATNIGTVATNKYNAGVAATKKGTAVAAQVLKGVTFTSANGVNLVGTMNNYSQNIQTVTPTAAQTGVATININDGYHTQIKVNSANVYNAGVAAGKAEGGYKKTGSYNNFVSTGVDEEGDRLDWHWQFQATVLKGMKEPIFIVENFHTANQCMGLKVADYNSTTGLVTLNTLSSTTQDTSIKGYFVYN